MTGTASLPPGLGNVAFALRAQVVIRQAAAALRAHGIASTLLAGPDLGVRLDGTPVHHTSGDAHVLIPSREAGQARRCLERAGWSFEPDVSATWRGIRRAGSKLGLSPSAFDHEGYYLRLHRRLPTHVLSHRSRQLLEARLRRGASAGASGFLEPDLEGLVVFLCVRATDLGFREASLADVRQVERLGPDWDEVWRLASDPSLEAVVRDALVEAHRPVRVRAGSRKQTAAVSYEGRCPPIPRFRRELEWISLLKEGFVPLRTAAKERFDGIAILTPDGVFKPWALSHELGRASLEAIPEVARPMLVDVGTGSGLIALTLARARSDAVVFGTDLSALAIRAARRNARALGAGSVRFRQGDLLGALPDGTAGRVSMIVSNIPSDPPTVSRHKRVPRRTLVGPEADGLGLVRRLIEESARYLTEGGTLVLMLRDWQRTSLQTEFEPLGFLELEAIPSEVAPFNFYILERSRLGR